MIKYFIFMMFIGHVAYAADAENLNGFSGQWAGSCQEQDSSEDPFPMVLAFDSGKKFSMEYEDRVILLGVPLPYLHKGEEGEDDETGLFVLTFDQANALNLYVLSDRSPENQLKWNITVNESQMRVRISQFLRFQNLFNREIITNCLLDKKS